MTTIVGIVALKEKPSVVLASDLTITREEWAQQGNFAVKNQTQIEGSKIFTDKDGAFAVSVAGLYDNAFYDFLNDLREGKINLQEAIEKGKFDAFYKLNLGRHDDKLWNRGFDTSMLIATRFDKERPRLYSCWPLGKLEEIDFGQAIGSGSEHAIDYLRGELMGITPRSLDVNGAVDLARGAIARASRDVYTKGLDLAVIQNNGIRTYGSRIKLAIDKALEDTIAGIKGDLTTVAPNASAK